MTPFLFALLVFCTLTIVFWWTTEGLR